MSVVVERAKPVFISEDATAPWRVKALCAQAVDVMPAMATAWVDEQGEYAATARQICADCTVRFQCAANAAGDPQTEGIRAGYAFEHGALNATDRRKLADEFGIMARLRKDTRSYR